MHEIEFTSPIEYTPPPPSEKYKEERHVLEEEMREIYECDMEELGTLQYIAASKRSLS